MSLDDPKYAAYQAIASVMAIGSGKDGRDDSWRQKPGFYHMTKGIRHAMTHLMQKMGVAESDGEDHLKLAITRLAFALAQESKKN